jgi:predicted restriction endonuclease
LPDEALDLAIKHNKLTLGLIPTDDQVTRQRLRKGQSRLRSATLEIYNHRCSICDVEDNDLMIAAHIS